MGSNDGVVGPTGRLAIVGATAATKGHVLLMGWSASAAAMG